MILGDVRPHRRDLCYLVPQWVQVVSCQGLTTAMAGTRKIGTTLSTCSTDNIERPCPSCPGCAPGDRPEAFRDAGWTRGLRARGLGAAAAPSLPTRQLRLQRCDPRGLLFHHPLKVPDTLQAMQQADHQRLHRHRRALPVAVRNRNLRRLIQGVCTGKDGQNNQPIPTYRTTPFLASPF